MTQEPDLSKQPQEEARNVPIVEEDFAKLLTNFKIKPDQAASIALNISHTGGPDVFENPEALTKRLIAWSGELAPAKRKLIIEQWFAEKGIPVPLELIKKVGMSTEQAALADEGGRSGVKYVYDSDKHVVRMAKDKEIGGSMDEAVKLKEMAEESASGGEPPFVPDGEGNYHLNPNARLTGMDLMAYEIIKKNQERGESIDPLEALSQATEKMKMYRDVLGGGSSEKPGWMTDPVAFISVVKDITGTGTDRPAQPGWMTDPAQFIGMIREIQGEGKGDEKLQAQISELMTTVTTLREDAHKQEIANLTTQIQQQGEEHKKQIDAIATKLEQAPKNQGGKTELDILHDVGTGAIEVIKTEASGMRNMIKEFVSSPKPPSSKTEEERTARKEDFREALENDREIDKVAERLFFS